jgi:signal transduction histidine kinase
MANQLDELLRISEQQQPEERVADINLSTFIIDLLKTIQKPENFIITIEGEMPILKAQYEALSRVFGNLLINAIQHHDKEEGRVRISHRDKGDFHEFRISDDGPGIPEEFRSKVFELFHTFHPVAHSSGIGLYLVRKTMESLSGNIEIENTDSSGTTFRVIWPKPT